MIICEFRGYFMIITHKIINYLKFKIKILADFTDFFIKFRTINPI